MGADGATKASGSTTTDAKKSEAAKAILAAIAGTPKEEKAKAADTKSSSTSASSVSGSVIGVGQNPVVTALQEQQGIAREQLACLQVIAGRTNGVAVDPNLTNKGATPVTPASRGGL
jgi:hypothetical protein